MSRGRWVMTDDLNNSFQVLLAPAARDAMTQHDLFPVIVQCRIKIDRAFAPFRSHLPSGQTARDFIHIGLCISAVNTESVKFEQFTRVVFIRDVIRAGLLVLLAVKVDEHGGWSGRRGG